MHIQLCGYAVGMISVIYFDFSHCLFVHLIVAHSCLHVFCL